MKLVKILVISALSGYPQVAEPVGAAGTAASVDTDAIKSTRMVYMGERIVGRELISGTKI